LDGAAVYRLDHRPVRLAYRLTCDPSWRTREGTARTVHVIERGTCCVGTPVGGTQQLASGDLLVAFGEHFLSDRDRPQNDRPCAAADTRGRTALMPRNLQSRGGKRVTCLMDLFGAHRGYVAAPLTRPTAVIVRVRRTTARQRPDRARAGSRLFEPQLLHGAISADVLDDTV
jgi:hypothetical protein